MTGLKQALMTKYLYSSAEADNEIKRLQALLAEYLEEGDMESAQEILMDECGLEPDFIFDLL